MINNYVEEELTRAIGLTFKDPAAMERTLTSEWLVTNGLGGYASGTISGIVTRRYHGYLVTALPAPYGRVMMLNDLLEQVIFEDNSRVLLWGEERANSPLRLHWTGYLKEFRLDAGIPVWSYEVRGTVFEKRVLMPHRQNTVHINYRVISGNENLAFELRPCINFRSHDAPVNTPLASPYTVTIENDRYEVSCCENMPRLRMLMFGGQASFTLERKTIEEIVYRIEESRGYEAKGSLWSPGYFRFSLSKGAMATLAASTERWETIQTLLPESALEAEYARKKALVAAAYPVLQHGEGAELVLAADQFMITPAWRREDAARAMARGEELRTIIAGYHWFTDWGRDSMISLEGLALVTGRHREAAWILSTFAGYIKEGLIPNMFPEGKKNGVYNTADATLWFFHAIERYVDITKDTALLKSILPVLRDIVRCHIAGTRFGIKVDPADGLLHQGVEGYALTWMDAKLDDWVVTPRRGKTVEINALWYNALMLLAGWLKEYASESESREILAHAEKSYLSFNKRFWYNEGDYLYDIVDGESGDDASCRPNQIFALSLAHPVLEESRWKTVLGIVRERLLTPVGLRSLDPRHADFKTHYYGDLRLRDAAYHQGTVWSWLIGPFIDAWLKAYPDDYTGARRYLDGLLPHLDDACIGSISEIFDAQSPFTARGCVAQAWSVAELLRCLVKTTI